MQSLVRLQKYETTGLFNKEEFNDQNTDMYRSNALNWLRKRVADGYLDKTSYKFRKEVRDEHNRLISAKFEYEIEYRLTLQYYKETLLALRQKLQQNGIDY